MRERSARSELHDEYREKVCYAVIGTTFPIQEGSGSRQIVEGSIVGIELLNVLSPNKTRESVTTSTLYHKSNQLQSIIIYSVYL